MGKREKKKQRKKKGGKDCPLAGLKTGERSRESSREYTRVHNRFCAKLGETLFLWARSFRCRESSIVFLSLLLLLFLTVAFCVLPGIPLRNWRFEVRGWFGENSAPRRAISAKTIVRSETSSSIFGSAKRKARRGKEVSRQMSNPGDSRWPRPIHRFFDANIQVWSLQGRIAVGRCVLFCRDCKITSKEIFYLKMATLGGGLGKKLPGRGPFQKHLYTVEAHPAKTCTLFHSNVASTNFLRSQILRKNPRNLNTKSPWRSAQKRSSDIRSSEKEATFEAANRTKSRLPISISSYPQITEYPVLLSTRIPLLIDIEVRGRKYFIALRNSVRRSRNSIFPDFAGECSVEKLDPIAFRGRRARKEKKAGGFRLAPFSVPFLPGDRSVLRKTAGKTKGKGCARSLARFLGVTRTSWQEVKGKRRTRGHLDIRLFSLFEEQGWPNWGKRLSISVGEDRFCQCCRVFKEFFPWLALKVDPSAVVG